MTEYQVRVVIEQRDLDEKVERLKTFLGGATFKTLAPDEQECLTRQARIMADYSAVLGERIASF